MEDVFSNFIDVILYFLGSAFCLAVLTLFYFQIKEWLKKQRRRNKRRRFENYKIRKANSSTNK